MKKFLISIDTEGDDLWSWRPGDKISTENAGHLPRFQRLCEEYGFKPTYLTNYEMARSERFRAFARETLKRGDCEIGMHLHAWNSPPLAELENRCGDAAPYLIEYPADVMEEKIAFMTGLLSDSFECPINSHRAGRWATNELYFELLQKYGYIVDCSVTPGMDWSGNPGGSQGSRGSDYSSSPKTPYWLRNGESPLLELPVTIRQRRDLSPHSASPKALVGMAYRALHPQKIWLRPRGDNLEQMLWLVEKLAGESGTDYIMFMLHSSEMMPGGSPNFKDAEAVERLYEHMEKVFRAASKHFEGMTLGQYGEEYIKRNRQGELYNG